MVVGERLELEFPGLGTAGYRWHSELSGDPDAVVLEWRSGTPADQGPGRRVGASATERLGIIAAAPGIVTVHLAQRRSWEAGPPKREHDIVIEVRPT